MSTATAFRHHRAFPFCVSEISGDVPAYTLYVDNLTLADVMAFAWNLETLTITTTGTATGDPSQVADAAAYITTEPIASDRYTHGYASYGSMMYGDSFSSTAFGSFPSLREPRERVCNPSMAINGCILSIEVTDNAHGGGAVYFFVGTDPGNSGKYRIYYLFDFAFSDPATDIIQLFFLSEASYPGMDAITNGTVTLGGLTMAWYAYCTAGATPSGVGFSASSGSFTY